MLINWTTQISGCNVTLVPYSKHHVLKYHEWMKVKYTQCNLYVLFGFNI